MKTRLLSSAAAIFLMTSCESYPMRAVQALVGTPAETRSATENPDIIRNEYHAACERRKQEAIKDILDLKEDTQ